MSVGNVRHKMGRQRPLNTNTVETMIEAYARVSLKKKAG
jgi:hypothetical protein